MNREDKLRLAKELIDSDLWNFFKEELQIKMDYTEQQKNAYIMNAEVEKSFLYEGIILGLKLARDLPNQVLILNKSYFNRMLDKINLEKNN